MSELKTDFNVSPYFDDYDEDKQFYRVLFNPRRAVQARELTQLQTIIQKQISRFGTHIFKEGSVVDGISVDYIPRLEYVHVANEFNGANLEVVTDIANNYLITNSLTSSEAVRAVPLIIKNGFVSNYPETNRIYLSYLSTGKDNLSEDQLTFTSGETLYIFDENQSKLGSLDGNNVIDTIDVITETASIDSTGIAYGLSISDGIIYQKGHFVKVDSQIVTVKDFDQDVNDYLVGFETEESIVNSSQDTSLKDQASGFSNFNAPGADRLRLIPTLASYSRHDPNIPDSFFPIVEFDLTTPSQVRVDPVYDRLGDVLARDINDTNGDFVVKPFVIETIADSSNADAFFYEVSPGIAYINGYRVELVGTKRVRAPRAIDTDVSQNQIITANYGNFIVVNELAGPVNLNDIAEVSFYDATQQAISSSSGSSLTPTGNIVGKANVKTLVYNSGTKGNPECRYLLYLFNIRMNSGSNFENDVKSVYGTSSFGNFVADTVLENSKTILKDINRSILVFNTGLSGVKTYEPDGVNDTSYIFRQTSSATMAANGFATFTIPSPAPGGNERIAFSPSSISDGNELNFNLYYSSNAHTANLSGTLDIVSGNTTVIGSGTDFNNELQANNILRINVDGSFLNRRIVNIANSTALELDSSIGSSNSAANYQKFFPQGSTINLIGANTINVLSNTQFTVDTTDTLDSGSVSIIGQYPVQKNTARSAKKRTRKNRFIKLDFSTHPNGILGPWNLGLSDIYKIRHVYVGSDYLDTNPDRKDWFLFDNGQKDSFYDHGRLIIKPKHRSKLTTSMKVLVELDHFVVDNTVGVGFFNVDSYPIDDQNPDTSNTISTAEIPLFRSETGETYNLRNVIDIRPIKISTANSVNTTDPANTFITINPSSNNNFDVYSTGQYLAEVDDNMIVDIEYFLSRMDLILMNKNGELTVKRGEPSVSPSAPFNESDTSVFGESLLSPFPSLTSREAEQFTRPDLRTIITSKTNRRYTMKDVGRLDKRIKRLEYYTVLNTLEQQAKELTIPSAIDSSLNRFKNGIFADAFNSHLNGKVEDFEYTISIDPREKIARPTFNKKAIDFRYDTLFSDGTYIIGDYVTLPFADERFLFQDKATSTRNPSRSGYQWTGNLVLYPNRDYYIDDVSTPNVIDIDFSQPWLEFAGSPFGSNYGDWRTSGTSRKNDVQNTTSGFVTTTTKTTTKTTQERMIEEILVDVVNNIYDFGNYVSDFAIQPYIRSQLVAFGASLRPNTRVYAFFDDEPVSAHCAPGVENENYTNDTIKETKEYLKVIKNGSYGDPLVTDSEGRLFGLFKIPDNRFRVGDRTFKLVNVPDLVVGEASIITSARAVFSAQNINVSREQLILSTQEPIITFNQDTQSRVLTDVSTTTRSINNTPSFGFNSSRNNSSGSYGGDSGGGSGSWEGADGFYNSRWAAQQSHNNLGTGNNARWSEQDSNQSLPPAPAPGQPGHGKGVAPSGGDSGGGGCFLAGTMATMSDGTEKAIELVDIGEEMKLGGKVFAAGKFLCNELYDYRGVMVSGSHLVKENGTWMRVRDSALGQFVSDEDCIVYVVGNENHMIEINGMIFSDYFEVNAQELLIANQEDFFEYYQSGQLFSKNDEHRMELLNEN